MADTRRFTFYGRMSTGEYQDATSSRGWQLDSTRQMIAGRGRILLEWSLTRRLSLWWHSFFSAAKDGVGAAPRW
jgi:hypothetical protein